MGADAPAGHHHHTAAREEAAHARAAAAPAVGEAQGRKTPPAVDKGEGAGDDAETEVISVSG